ncbi:nitrilase-related carbon-nitrogen hydrolase [Candidatus Foliamicus sp.]
MLIISQTAWSAGDAAALATNIHNAMEQVRQRQLDALDEPLLLLPQAEPADEAPEQSALLAALGEIAARESILLAGAAPMMSKDGVVTIGFLMSAGGEALLAAPKISPDLANGFRSECSSALGRPAKFQTASTGLGQVGILPGEDALFAHLARALTWAGAEIILNPVAEVNDHLFEARLNARRARAWENTGFVAVAGAVGGRPRRPACSRLIDFNGAATCATGETDLLLPDLDIQRLRRRRNDIFAVQPLHLRANLYADGYQRLIDSRAEPLPPPPRTRAEWIGECGRRQAQRPAPSHPERIEQYDVILTQTMGKLIRREDDVHALRRDNTLRAMRLAERLASSPSIKLVVMPEFFMHGQGGHGFRSPITLQRLAIRYPGPEMELLQDFALKHKVYVAGSSFEIDDKLPGHVFNSAFILGDTGELIHRYRKIQCADVWGSLPDTTPSSIYDRYLDIYGYDFLFPVADTPIGQLGTMVCFDQAHPEVARMLTQYGAEIIIHPSSEGHGSQRSGWDAARVTRAFENTAYVLSAMPGAEFFHHGNGELPTAQMRGYTKMVNFDGSVQGVADGPGACILTGTVDLKALQRARANPLTHLPLWDDPEVYAQIYAGEVGLPNNLWGSDPLENPYVGFGPLKSRLESYYAKGVFVRPSGVDPNAPVSSSRVYGPPLKARKSHRLADQERLDGESIQV